MHNLGLIYYDTENYEKAATAFQQALKLDNQLASRHLAYAKVQEKLGNVKLTISELNKAVELEPNRETYNLLYKTYITNNMHQEAEALKKKLRRKLLRNQRVVKLKRPKKAII